MHRSYPRNRRIRPPRRRRSRLWQQDAGFEAVSRLPIARIAAAAVVAARSIFSIDFVPMRD